MQNHFATKITTTNHEGKTIISIEKIFGFFVDTEAEYKELLKKEEEFNRMANMRSTINLN